ncbi:MAG: isochorismatase family protein [Candidatus Hydrogenedens sp.]|jgi:nicotinamidase/pyrazinamidase|nr:isochorismatase family protein [Candidatus Hydrogenedens sp.]
MITTNDTDALIIVDVQNDFCSGGSLPVPDAELVIDPINRLQRFFDYLFFSRDWHPSDHCSFSDNQQFGDGHWPPHCVQNSPGAEFHGDLRIPVDATVVNKATSPEQDAYSAFDGTDLTALLKKRNIQRVFVVGLALDFCVKATALDAIKNGFSAFVVRNGTMPVFPENTAQVYGELQAAGVELVDSDDFS